MDPKQPAPKGQPLSPEQDKLMKMAVAQAIDVITEPGSADFIVEKAKAGNPEAAVVEMVAPLLKMIFKTASDAGARIEVPTALAAGIIVIGEIAGILQNEGVIQEKDVPAFCAKVAQLAVVQHNKAAVAAGAKVPAEQPQQPAQQTKPGMTGMVGA